MGVGVLTVKRWTRYGKDRLYVSTEDGQRVGWLDLLTGESRLDLPEMADAFHEAVRGHQHALGGAVQASGPDNPQPVTEPSMTQGLIASVPPAVIIQGAEPAVPAWTDLAGNRPGQGVRAEAQSRLAEMQATSKIKTFVTRVFDRKTDERAFRVGADGEESVGARLDRLTKHGWYVLHSIPVGQGDSDIDHLVITKGGVYPVNTKRRPGARIWVGEKAILVNGQKTDYLRNSRYEGERVRKALRSHLSFGVPVKPVLVFLTGTVLPQVTIKQMPEDVLVLDRMDVPGAFKRSPQRLTLEMIEQIYEVARRSTTWR